MNQGNFSQTCPFWVVLGNSSAHCFQLQSQSQNGKGNFCNWLLWIWYYATVLWANVENLMRESGRNSQQRNEISYTHPHFNVQVILQLLSAFGRLVLWKKQSSCHGPTTQTLHHLTSLLGSCTPWLLVLIWRVRPAPCGTWESIAHMEEFSLSCPAGVLSHEDRTVPCCSAASQRHRVKGRGGLRSVPGYLGLGLSFCHSQSLSCCFRQSRAFVTCVVPTWTDSTLASTVSSLAVLQRNIFTSTRRQSDTT